MSKSDKKKQGQSFLWQNKDYYIYLFIIAVIVFAAFIPSLNNGFTNWDDDIYVTENWKIKALSWYNIKHIFSTTHYGGYEPLTELFFAIEYHFFNLNPSVYHLNNLILHIINCMLVFYLIFLISGRIDVSFFTALLFGIHPMRVESVAWISELKDVLFTLLLLLSLTAYIHYIQKKDKKYFYYSIVMFFISMLPKSQGLMFPFVLILTDYFLNRKINKKTLIEKTPFFLISFVFFLVLYFGAKETSQIGGETTSSLLQNISYANFGLIFYLVRLILPVGLSNCYPLPEKSGDMLLQAVYYAAPFLVIAITVFIILKKKNKMLVFAALFYLINLFLVLQLKRTNVTAAAERYTYLPYLGVFYFVSDGFISLYYKQKKNIIKAGLIALTVIALTAFSFLTWQRCKVWKDSFTLWSDTLKKYPNTPVAHNHFAVYYQTEEKNYEKAVYHFKRAMEIDPYYFAPYNNLGILYHDMKEYDKAIEIFNKGLKLNNNVHQLYYNIGFAYHKLKKLDEALLYYKKAIEKRQNYLGPYNNLARALMEQKKYIEAEYYIKQALVYNPNYIYAYVSYADLMAETGKNKEALFYFNKALSIMPDNSLVLYELSVFYIKTKEYMKAVPILENLIKRDKKNALPYAQLAKVYYELKDYNKFKEYLDEALELEPDNEDVLEITGSFNPVK